MILFIAYPVPLLRAEQKDDMLEILQFLPKSQDWISLFRELCDYREERLKTWKLSAAHSGQCVHMCGIINYISKVQTVS